MSAFKRIEGFENYLIFRDGSVYNLNNGRYLIPSKTFYYRVGLYDGIKYHHKSIHRLLAKAFIPNPNNLPQVNHKDGDKDNYRLDNLEWCDQSYNNKHAYDNELRVWSKSSRDSVAKTLGTEEFEVYKDDILVGKYTNKMDCERDIKVNNANIGKCLKGVFKQCNGYVFKQLVKSKL